MIRLQSFQIIFIFGDHSRKPINHLGDELYRLNVVIEKINDSKAQNNLCGHNHRIKKSKGDYIGETGKYD